MLVNLTRENEQKIEHLARQTGRTPAELVNEAVERLPIDDADEQRRFEEWRQAMLKVKGIWTGRDDLPDFGEIRRSMDRDLWSR